MSELMSDHELILRAIIKGWGVLTREYATKNDGKIVLKFNSEPGPPHEWTMPEDLSLTDKRREALNKLLDMRLYAPDTQAALKAGC